MSKGSVWLRPEKRSPLRRDQIVAATVALLDEDGVAGLTIRKLAARLGAAPMTLYNHLSTKDDLLEYALDAVFAEALEEVASSGDWRADLTTIATNTFDALLRHPWAPALVGGRPPIGPAAVAHFRAVLRVLTDANFPVAQGDSATTAIYYYVIGAALVESAWGRSEGQAISSSAVDSADVREFLGRQAGGDARLRFEQGLRCVLDGLAH